MSGEERRGGPARELRLPLFLCGELLEGEEEALELTGPEGRVRVLLPRVGPAELARAAAGRRDLAEVPLEEILSFLARASARWADPARLERALALEQARLVTGFSDAELALDLSYLEALLCPERFLRPTLAAELRDPRALDGWVRRAGSEVRAFPRGRVLHLLAGNVPGSEALSLVRALLTKNASLLKLASGNPVTPVALLRSFRALDPDHPVTRSTSVLYWPHGSPAEAAAFALADAVCVWGGAEAVRSACSLARPGQTVLDYGPKRSLAFIDREAIREPAAAAEVAAALALDVSVHDQQACHSPQLALVERPARAFCQALGAALDEVSRSLPRGFVSLDTHAELSHLRAMAELQGDTVLRGETGGWTLILTEDLARAAATVSPLARTLLVVEVDDLAEAARLADSTTMVIGFSSRRQLEQLRDGLALRGVDRLTLVGRMGLPPPGFPHEARYDLTRLVRWVGCDGA